jgi:hypothetical protein
MLAVGAFQARTPKRENRSVDGTAGSEFAVTIRSVVLGRVGKDGSVVECNDWRR